MQIELWGGGEAQICCRFVTTEAPHQYVANWQCYLSHVHGNIYDAQSRFSKFVRNRNFSKI